MRKASAEWKEKYRPLCIEDIKEAIENPFILHAKEIQSICYERGVDVGVGLDMWRNEHPEVNNVEDTILTAWIREYKYLCREYYLDFIVECLEEVHNGDL